MRNLGFLLVVLALIAVTLVVLALGLVIAGYAVLAGRDAGTIQAGAIIATLFIEAVLAFTIVLVCRAWAKRPDHSQHSGAQETRRPSRRKRRD